jgi:hypothetical protein
MVYEALQPYVKPGLTARFISNIDPTDVAEKTKDLDPETTLFIVASKTFTTLETLTNARLARGWLLDKLRESERSKRATMQPTPLSPGTAAVSPRRQGGQFGRPGERIRLLGLGRRALLSRFGNRYVRRSRHRTCELR